MTELSLNTQIVLYIRSLNSENFNADDVLQTIDGAQTFFLFELSCLTSSIIFIRIFYIRH